MEYRLGQVEAHFAELIWDNEPLGSGDLVKLCKEQLGWQKSTTYTVLKKLCDKGFFVNEGGLVRSLIPREVVQTRESREYVAERFGGSLPAFINAFTAGRGLTREEAEGLRQMIEAYEEGEES